MYVRTSICGGPAVIGTGRHSQTRDSIVGAGKGEPHTRYEVYGEPNGVGGVEVGEE